MKVRGMISRLKPSVSRKTLITVAIILLCIGSLATIAIATNTAWITASTDSDFQEADLTNLEIVGSGASATVDRLAPEAGSLLDFTSTHTGTRYIDGGWVIEPHEDVGGLDLSLYRDSGFNTVEIRRMSDDELIASQNIADGQTDVSIHANLHAGVEYRVYVLGDQGTGSDRPDFPETSNDFTLVSGWDGGDQTKTNEWIANIGSIQVYTGHQYDNAEYVHTHSVTDPQDARVVIDDVVDMEISAQWQYHDGTTWQTAATETITTAGTYTRDVSAYSADEWRIVLSADATTSNWKSWSMAMDEEGFSFENTAPIVDNSSAQPNTNELITETTVELSVDVSDPQFADAQGEEVTVTFYDESDGSVIGTDTLTSNGTATVQWDSPLAGENNWSVTATDSYGGSTSSETFSFNMPEEIRIYNESAPDTLVENTEVTIEFYFEDGSETIVERETTDGTVDMTGLPVDRPFIVVAEGDGYLPRRIFVEDLTTRQEVYLLPDSAEFVESTFELEDLSGAYATDETVLIIQRNLNGSWETVQGDFFGATGEWTAQLAYNKRHRLIVKNIETGKERSVGTFTPTSSDRHTIRVSMEEDIQLLDSGAIVSVSPSARSLPAESSATFLVELAAVDELVEWSVEATWSNSTTSEQLVNVTNEGPTGGEVNPTVDLTDKSDGDLMVSVAWETVPGESGSYQVEFAVRELFDDTYALLPTIQRGVGQLAPENVGTVTTMLAVIFTVIITAAAGQHLRLSSEILGLVAILSFSGFWALGWLNWGLLFAAGVAWIAGMGVRRGL